MITNMANRAKPMPISARPAEAERLPPPRQPQAESGFCQADVFLAEYSASQSRPAASVGVRVVNGGEQQDVRNLSGSRSD